MVLVAAIRVPFLKMVLVEHNYMVDTGSMESSYMIKTEY